jgi:hypothetical protein
MSSRPVVRSLFAGHSIRRERGGRLAERVGAVGRAGALVWERVRGPAAVLLGLLLTFTGVAAMLWLLYELASWWITVAAQPFPGTAAGLEHLFR